VSHGLNWVSRGLDSLRVTSSPINGTIACHDRTRCLVKELSAFPRPITADEVICSDLVPKLLGLLAKYHITLHPPQLSLCSEFQANLTEGVVLTMTEAVLQGGGISPERVCFHSYHQ